MDESGSDTLLVAMVGTVGVAGRVGFNGGVGFTVPFFALVYSLITKINDQLIHRLKLTFCGDDVAN